MSAFFASLIIVVAVTAWVSLERDPRRTCAAFAGLVLAAITRNLVWVVVGLEAFSLASAPFRLGTLVASSSALIGLVVVALSARTTDLASLAPTPAVVVGSVLIALGAVAKWSSSRAEPFHFLGAGVALVAIVARANAWAPDVTATLAPLTWLIAVAIVVIAGLGSATASDYRALSSWIALSTVALAVLGLGIGPTAWPHVLAFVAAAALMLVLVLAGSSSLGTWAAMLSLASLPPFPGFVTKLAVLAALPQATLVWVLFGLGLTAVGCVRAIHWEPPSTGRRWASVAAVAIAIACGVLPETFLRIAARAAAGLF